MIQSSSERDLAIALGADLAVEPAAAASVGEAPRLVVECSGKAGVIDQAMQLAAVDGCVTVVGICPAPDTLLPWWGLHKELDVRFAMYYGRDDFAETIAAMEGRRLDAGAMVTETVTLDGLPERFLQLAATPDAGKVVVIP